MAVAAAAAGKLEILRNLNRTASPQAVRFFAVLSCLMHPLNVSFGR
jgi:hypothetical protein